MVVSHCSSLSLLAKVISSRPLRADSARLASEFGHLCAPMNTNTSPTVFAVATPERAPLPVHVVGKSLRRTSTIAVSASDGRFRNDSVLADCQYSVQSWRTGQYRH